MNLGVIIFMTYSERAQTGPGDQDWEAWLTVYYRPQTKFGAR